MKLAIVAGEASGDLHASEVVAALKKLDPELQTFGIGGDLLEREGMRVLHHAREMGIVGLFNVLRHLGMFRTIFKEFITALATERPDAVLLVDYPGFNLRVAKQCKAMGLRVIYYISPQVWAWRRGRVKHIARYVDEMLVIFPFEEEFYRGHDVRVTYVGHPLIDEMHVPLTPASRTLSPRGGERDDSRVVPRDTDASAGPDSGVVPRPAQRGEGARRAGEGPLRIALLPGSRRSEIDVLLPPMLDAIALLKQQREVDAFIVQAPTITAAELLAIMQRNRTIVRIVPHDRGESLASADVAVSSSGTATLECAIAGTPVVVVYRLSPANYWLAKRVVTLPHISLVNIIAGKKVVPELLQHDVNGEHIARVVREMTAPAESERIRRDLAAVRAKLGAPGASRRAAEEIMRFVQS